MQCEIAPPLCLLIMTFRVFWLQLCYLMSLKLQITVTPKRFKGSFQWGPRTTELLVIWKIFTKQVELKKQWWNPPSRWQTKDTQKVYTYALRNKALRYFFVCILQILKVLFGPFMDSLFSLSIFFTCLITPIADVILLAEDDGMGFFFFSFLKTFQKAFLVDWMDQCWIAQG